MPEQIGKYMRAIEQTPAARTRRWSVHDTHGGQLGEIAWYSGWRCYVFRPDPGTEFSSDCLRYLADFLEAKTRQQKEATDG